jgi:hypothetical protein
VSLLDQLVDARLIVVDEEHRLVYAWFGGAGVNVYDEHGNEVHYFTVGGTSSRLTPSTVRSAIERVRASEHI